MIRYCFAPLPGSSKSNAAIAGRSERRVRRSPRRPKCRTGRVFYEVHFSCQRQNAEQLLPCPLACCLRLRKVYAVGRLGIGRVNVNDSVGRKVFFSRVHTGMFLCESQPETRLFGASELVVENLFTTLARGVRAASVPSSPAVGRILPGFREWAMRCTFRGCRVIQGVRFWSRSAPGHLSAK